MNAKEARAATDRYLKPPIQDWISRFDGVVEKIAKNGGSIAFIDWKFPDSETEVRFLNYVTANGFTITERGSFREISW